MDDVMAGRADRESFAAHVRHGGRPDGLAWSGFAETDEFTDLMNGHFACVLYIADTAPVSRPIGADDVERVLVLQGGPVPRFAMTPVGGA